MIMVRTKGLGGREFIQNGARTPRRDAKTHDPLRDRAAEIQRCSEGNFVWLKVNCSALVQIQLKGTE